MALYASMAMILPLKSSSLTGVFGMRSLKFTPKTIPQIMLGKKQSKEVYEKNCKIITKALRLVAMQCCFSKRVNLDARKRPKKLSIFKKML